MARAKSAKRRRKTFPFGLPADLVPVAARVSSSANRMTARRLTDIKTLRVGVHGFGNRRSLRFHRMLSEFLDFSPNSGTLPNLKSILACRAATRLDVGGSVRLCVDVLRRGNPRFSPRCKGNLAGLPGRSLERLWLGVMYSPPSLHFGAAVFALRCAPSEDWCQRLESNQ